MRRRRELRRRPRPRRAERAVIAEERPLGATVPHLAMHRQGARVPLACLVHAVALVGHGGKEPQHLGLEATVARLAAQRESPVAVHARLDEPARVVRHDREVARVGRLEAEVAHLAVDGDCSLERGPRDVEPSLERGDASEEAEGAPFLAALLRLAIDRACSLEQTATFRELALHEGEHRQPSEDASHRRARARRGREREGRLRVADGLLTATDEAIGVRASLERSQTKRRAEVLLGRRLRWRRRAGRGGACRDRRPRAVGRAPAPRPSRAPPLRDRAGACGDAPRGDSPSRARATSLPRGRPRPRDAPPSAFPPAT